MKIAKVTWIDAKTILNYTLIEEEIKEQKPLEVESVGFLVVNDKEKVILSSFIYKDNYETDHKYIHVIPKCMVKKIEEVK